MREAGLEPARPEWTLEPELKNYRFNTYRQVLLSVAQSVENTGFFVFSHETRIQQDIQQKRQFVGCLLDV